ncbi:MAG: alanine--tRNA ligase [Candidatus Omnitrophica bacterium]|nr:alanine--tRNA ligase [Candidatus Omnitrophota bacterium]
MPCGIRKDRNVNTNELREKYLKYFQRKGHALFPSDTLVPDDPTVLFTSAGMNQFKPYFLGEKKDVSRAASCQKCFRTGDLEEVGRTPFHHTFFEMLGNFSFGDYFKREAIAYAWEFLTAELEMSSEDLWVSVYRDDEAAYRIWVDEIGFPEHKIVRLDEDKNFWPANAPSAGPDGPCGPCSEIFYDKGADAGCRKKECGPACDCGRFVEIWNLVFTEFNRCGENDLRPLPQKNIDTGMGLERMASVLQKKDSNFEIDIFAPLISHTEAQLGVSRRESESTLRAVRLIADHARAAAFSICDGVYPSNEERGYVVRKVIRKAVWSAYLLGKKEPFLCTFIDPLVATMAGAYPELKEKSEILRKVIRTEEEKFFETLEEGNEQFTQIAERKKAQGSSEIEAEEVFRLYDTYGFPLELSELMAAGYGLTVDRPGFMRLLSRQREQSRKKSMFQESIFTQDREFSAPSVFRGYEALTLSGRISHVFTAGAEQERPLRQGEEGLVILPQTPFYPEGGGQCSDQGRITTGEGEFLVEAVYKAKETIIHKGRVVQGTIAPADSQARVDPERRAALSRAHTATHILQSVLRKVLGDHVVQQGSYVDADRFRFDFTHFAGLSYDQLQRIEAEVNRRILRADPVRKEIMDFSEAKRRGALAFFKEKYSDSVRMVSVGEFSRELCGGTHLDTTAQVGSCALLSESSISSGIRRIEAATGWKAYEHFRQNRQGLAEIAVRLKTVPAQVPEAIEKLQSELKKAQDLSAAREKELMQARIDTVRAETEPSSGIRFLAHVMENPDRTALFNAADALKESIGSVFLFLYAPSQKKPLFLCTATDDLLNAGLSMRDFLQKTRAELQLKGGGNDRIVQGVVGASGEGYIEKVRAQMKRFLTRKEGV